MSLGHDNWFAIRFADPDITEKCSNFNVARQHGDNMSGVHLGMSPPDRDNHVPEYPQLHDCVLVSKEGENVPANTFVMVQACSLLSSLFEDMDETSDRVFSIPNVDTSTLATLAALLHGRKHVKSMTNIAEIRRVLVAMDYLGCRSKFSRLVSRLWSLLRLLPNTPDTFDLLCENATLVMPEYCVAFLGKAKSIHPEWHRFQKLLDEVDMNPKLAVHCMEVLCVTFPPLMIVNGIINSSPPNHLHQILTSIINMPRIGLQFHPEEFTLFLKALVKSSKSDDQSTSLAKACLDSYTGVNSPSCTSKVTGSLIFFQHKSRCSFLITLKRPLSKKAKVQFQHGTASFDLDGERGTVQSSIQLHRFNENAESANDAYIRTVPIYASELGSSEIDSDMKDTWHSTDIDHTNKGSIAHRVDLPAATFPLLRHIRYDIFWLHDPRI